MKLSLVESRLFGRICYGYRRDKQGIVEIVPEEAEVVRTVFGLYRAGNSLEAIQCYLFNQEIPSPSGKTQWSRDVLNKLLNNGKYTKGTNETEERITHNIFYTAITRAKNKLKIYWSPETEQSVLERLEVKSSQKDAHLLSQLSSLTMAN